MSETSASQNSQQKWLRLLKAEAEKRLAAQRSLARFIEYRDAGIVPAFHHQFLIGELEKVERGETRNLMVCMPPGSAKSTYTSVEFPAWFLGRNAKLSVLAASHTAELAERFGRRVRNIVGSGEFRGVFGVGLADDSQAAGRWDTSEGGEYYAAGVGGSITGRRADLAIIDDPVKSREDADSERQREKAWEWYTNDLLTRLKPGARQIVVMTRWHEDDLGGRILERDRANWKLIEIPMEAFDNDPLGRKPGERLWPEWFTDDMVRVAKLDRRAWSALYQQRPSPEDGTYFQRAWFKTWADRPKDLAIYGTSDYAVSDGKGDYTVHRIWGVSPDGDLYRLGGWRDQTTSDVWIERQIDLIQKYKPFAWFGEAGVIQKAIEPMLVRRMRERKAFCRMEWLPSIHDKPTRARGFQARAAMGAVWFEQGAELDEFLRFPAGANDDDVDCASLIGRALDEAHPAIAAVPEKPKVRDKYDREDDDEADNWKTA
jgi:predicted phage terminase large subunit-like protein